MTKVLVDASSIYGFLEYLSRKRRGFLTGEHVPELSPSDFSTALIGNAIEVFVLYDKILLDEQTYKNRWIAKLIEEIGRDEEAFVPVGSRNIESIYEKALHQLQISDEITWQLIRDEQDNQYRYPLAHNHFVVGRKLETTIPNYKACLEKFREPYKNRMRSYFFQVSSMLLPSLFYNMVRFFYYKELQDIYGCDLVLHPCRQLMIGQFNMKYNFSSRTFVDNFEGIRRNLRNQEDEWLGQCDDSLNCPMVAAYVLNRADNIDDIIKQIVELRNSEEARSFREGLSTLISLVKKGSNNEVCNILNELNDIRECWESNMGDFPKFYTKTIHVSTSLPFIEAGMNVDVSTKRKNETTIKLLTLVHKLILNQSCSPQS